MSLDYDTALVDASEAQKLLGLGGLPNLDSEDGPTVDERLLTAHRWIYDILRARHGAAAIALVTNERELKPAVAYRFAEQLAANSLLDVEQRDYFGGQWLAVVGSVDRAGTWAPEFADDTSAGRVSSESLPGMANLTPRPLFNGGRDDYYTRRPRRRTS